MTRGRFYAAAAAVLFILAASPASANDCVTVDARARAAVAGKNISAMQSVHAETSACDPQLANWLGSRIASMLYNRAVAVTPADEAQLLAALEYGRNWQILAALGDLASERRDHALASRRYQEALVEISDVARTPKVPDEAVILAIRKRAEQSGLLSPTYVPTARGRDGANAGLAATAIRGVKVTAVALPIQFRFDSAEFTESGTAAVTDLKAMLANERDNRAQIFLVGHTDPSGDADYNLALSRRRAEAVRAFLVRGGIKREIVVEGRGEAEPYRADDPGRYTQAEKDQMSRRVELRRP